MLVTHALLSGAQEDHLIDLGNGHKLQSEVSNAFSQMQQAAFKAGLDLQIASSFRHLDRQLTIWNSKWRGERTLYAINGKVLEASALSEQEKLNAILTWSALPGSSRHHWGTDIDVMDKKSVQAWGKPFELVPEEYEKGGPCYQLSCWLQEHATEYGFTFPYASYTGGVAAEPWHLSYQPISSVLSRHITYDYLYELIDSIDIEGKAIILESLSTIIERFIVIDKG